MDGKGSTNRNNRPPAEGATLIEMDEQTRKASRIRRKELQDDLEEGLKVVLRNVPPTDVSLQLFQEKLNDPRWMELIQLVDMMKTWDVVKTIPEDKSFIYHTRLYMVLAQMLLRIDQYEPYLRMFIARFNAENELAAPPDGPGRSDAPIHFAALQLQEDFLQWLLARSGTDVNLRNNQRETALVILCDMYDKAVQQCRSPNASEVRSQLARIEALIERLLEAGADFNICSAQLKLPVELLLRHTATADEEVKAFVQRCIHRAGYALVVLKSEGCERRIGFLNNDTNVKPTEELFEICLRCGDVEQFAKLWAGFTVTEQNVKRVIRLVLHTTLDQKLADCLWLVVEKCKHLIFQVCTPSQRRTRRSDPKFIVMVHRVELKGLLRKACEMADLGVLKLLVTNITDQVLLNDDPLLALTLNKANKKKRSKEEEAALLACADYLADTHTIYMSKADDSGNTPLHLALKYGFDKVAVALLNQKYAYLGLRNRDNLTPLDYGTYEFWRSFLDQCIAVEADRGNGRRIVRFNLNCFEPFTHGKGALAAANRGGRRPPHWRFVQDASSVHQQPRRYERTVTEMTTVRQIAQSKELKQLLIHPVVHTFIMVKWMRLSHWNYLNLLLTALTAVLFGAFSLTACSRDGSNSILYWMSVVATLLVAARELLQMVFLCKSYLSFENILDLGNVAAMAFVLWYGCNGVLSSLVIVSLAMQVTFLLGSLPFNSLSTMMYMFKTVSQNFLKSFLLFIPLIVAFIYAFYLTYNASPDEVEARDACTNDDCAERNFNSFHTIWNATIKTLVMTTGELEAATFDFADGKLLLFVLFLFIAPIVIMNLINGLAVSDIAAIREESELISIGKKVMLLEQYERGVANVRPGWLSLLFPRPFFAEHNCWIQVHAKEFRKIEVHPKGKDEPPEKPMGKQRRQEAGKFVPISVFPWLGDGCSNLLLNFRIFKIALFMRLDQSIMNEALAIHEKHHPLALKALQATLAVTPETPPIIKRPIHTAEPVVVARQARRAAPSAKDPTAQLYKELHDLKGQMAALLELVRVRPQLRKQQSKVKGLKRKARKRARLALKSTVSGAHGGDH